MQATVTVKYDKYRLNSFQQIGSRVRFPQTAQKETMLEQTAKLSENRLNCADQRIQPLVDQLN